MLDLITHWDGMLEYKDRSKRFRVSTKKSDVICDFGENVLSLKLPGETTDSV